MLHQRAPALITRATTLLSSRKATIIQIITSLSEREMSLIDGFFFFGDLNMRLNNQVNLNDVLDCVLSKNYSRMVAHDELAFHRKWTPLAAFDE